MPPRLLTPRDRVAAWVVTGPVAHFAFGALDWLELAGRLAVRRLRSQRKRA